jgi:hypothetical protein
MGSNTQFYCDHVITNVYLKTGRSPIETWYMADDKKGQIRYTRWFLYRQPVLTSLDIMIASDHWQSLCLKKEFPDVFFPYQFR